MSKTKTRRRKGKPQGRRVLMQPPWATKPTWEHDYRDGLRSAFKTYPVVRLTDDGPDWGARPGPGDEIGYGMDPYRTDDCLTAAIATALQVPVEQVPDLRLDERIAAGEDPVHVSQSSWERIADWAEALGLRMAFHDEVPVDRERWIGVCPDPEGSWMLGDHCLVMAEDRLLFDPSLSVKRPPGFRHIRWEPSQVGYGLSFDKEGVTNG